MATIVLTAVGTVLGGPIGGALGALAGQVVDRGLFGQRPAEGARLASLAVQGASYGAPLPRLYGRMRVAGQVIWATDLKERRGHSGGGKGRPSTTTYSYSASLAVALSARPIRGIGRVWADGRLIRDNGQWSVAVGVRVHEGSEDQPVDPLIASAEGMASTPAFRGIAYVVLEDLDLTDFGNRIPMLSFEIEVDEDGTTLGRVIDDLVRDIAPSRTEGQALAGLAVADTGSARQALAMLAGIATLALTDDGEQLGLSEAAGGDPVPVAGTLLGARNGQEGGASRLIQEHGARTADTVVIAYLDVGRDYQAGLQRARADMAGQREERIELPVALDAGTAKALAERRLDEGGEQAETMTLSVPLAMAAVRPGDIVALPHDGQWRVRGWTLADGVVTLDLSRRGRGPVTAAASDPGRSVGQSLADPGTTILNILEVPPEGSGGDSVRLLAGAAGSGAGWRGARIDYSLDGGASWQEAGWAGRGLVAGVAIEPPGTGTSALFDMSDDLNVLLAGEGMSLAGCTDASLLAGANLAMLGKELIQFGEARQTGARTWRLSRLLRGRRGTEAAMAGHQPGETFTPLAGDGLVAIDLPLERVGTMVRVRAVPPPPGTMTEAGLIPDGAGLKPLAPIFIRAARGADGGIDFAWVRRSRLGWGWMNGIEVPLDEPFERWRVAVTPAGGVRRQVEVDSAAWRYDPAAQAADSGGPVSALTIEVAQVGARLGAGATAARTLMIAI